MQSPEQAEWSDRHLCGFDIVAGEFVVVSAEAADIETYAPLKALLRRVRKVFGMDWFFICEFAGGQQVVRVSQLCSETSEQSPHDVLEAAYGRSLIGEDRFEAVSVVGNDGLVYGTLCCRADTSADADAVYAVARLIADWFTGAELRLSGLMPMSGESVMGTLTAGLH